MRITTPGDVVSPDDVLALIRRRYRGLVLTTTWGARALRYNPGDALGHGIDFVTVEESDPIGDAPASLDAVGAYRVSFGVAPERYRALFGAAPAWGTPAATIGAAARPDTITPHPIYGWMSWAAVVNPSAATLDRLWPLLDEGYAIAVRAHDGRARRAGRSAPNGQVPGPR